MKLFSKMIAVVLTTVGAVGTVAGIGMFAGGGTQFATNVTPDNTGAVKTDTYGIGWLNFDSAKNGDLTFDAYLASTNTQEYKDANKALLDQVNATIKTYEEAIKTGEIQGQKLTDEMITIAKKALEGYKMQRNGLNALSNAQGMYNLAIAGVSIMSVGLVISALSAFVAIKIENSEEKKIAKKNKTANS